MKLERPQREETPLLSEQMKAWSTALAAELSDWPQVTLKSFFGFTALYRGKTMFGMLPRTRSIFKGNAVAFRINSANGSLQGLIEKDPRISPFDKERHAGSPSNSRVTPTCMMRSSTSAEPSKRRAIRRKIGSCDLL